MKFGVILSLADDRTTGISPRFQEVRRSALLVEAAGFDSAWIYDHLLVRRPGQPTLGVWESWTVLSALAEATERVTLGTWVLSSAFRNPGLLAKMATTLDEVSLGRFVLGLGAGNQEPEFKAFGFDFARRFDAFADAVEIIAALLHGEATTYAGRISRVEDCELRPRGPTPGGPPLLIGADGPRMMRLTARFADLWNGHYLGSAQLLQEKVSALHEACRIELRDPMSIGITVGESIWYEDQGPTPSHFPAPVLGDGPGLPNLVRAYARMGVDHLLLQVTPPRYAAALERLCARLPELRAASAAGTSAEVTS